jgi:hypothetical protein
MKTYLGLDDFLSAVKSASDYKNFDLSLFENCFMLFVILTAVDICYLYVPLIMHIIPYREVTEQIVVLK